MICFVILHYQAVDETVGCIASIEKISGKDYKIIVVDNASPNHSGKLIQRRYASDSHVEVLLENDNLGFAKGNNVGFRVAKKYYPDYIVVMNNDVLIEQQDFLEAIRKSDEQYSFDVLGPDILSLKTGIHQNPQREKNYSYEELTAYIRRVHWKNQYKFLIRLKYMMKRKPKIKSVQKTDYKRAQFNVLLQGSCYIFSRRFAESHENCFYPGTFWYFETYILHYLGMREGMKFVYDPSVKVLHHEDVATDQTYPRPYQKSVFSNKCLEDSARCFLKVMQDESIRLNDVMN